MTSRPFLLLVFINEINNNHCNKLSGFPVKCDNYLIDEIYFVHQFSDSLKLIIISMRS